MKIKKENQPDKPAVDPQKYYKDSGLYDHFKAGGLRIRHTHSLDAMARQHDEYWKEYLDDYNRQAAKVGNQVDQVSIDLARKYYVKREIDVYTGFLQRSGETNDLIEIGKHLDNLRSELARLDEPPPPDKKHSFQWTGSQAQLEALCQALKAGYIHPEATKETFTAIFASELIKDKPVPWLGSNRLLSYLFNQMYSSSLILSQDWQSIIERYQIFKNKKGKILKACDLSTALSNINDPNSGINPKGSDQIDEILKNLKTLRP